MGISEVERDLKFIRETMESSSRYTNVPASAYVATGVLGCLGTCGTYAFLGKDKLVNSSLVTTHDLKALTIFWALILAATIGMVIFCIWRKARQHQISAWNSLAARMILSQIPLVIVAGILTIAIAARGDLYLIPGVWLGLYGVILYSFSYFTGMEHKIEGIVFIGLGSLALFTPGLVSLTLLGIGFGGIHIVSGIVRVFSERKGTHESESVR